MKEVTTEHWQLLLPEEWQVEQLDDAIAITDEDQVGELLISVLEFSEPVEGDAEVEAFASSVTDESRTGRWLTVGDMRAWYYDYPDQEDYVREWYIADGQLILVISYCCGLENRQMDDAAIDEILSTLSLSVKLNDDA